MKQTCPALRELAGSGRWIHWTPVGRCRGGGRHAREAQETREGRRSPLHTLESPATPSMLSSKRHCAQGSEPASQLAQRPTACHPTGQRFPQLSDLSRGSHLKPSTSAPKFIILTSAAPSCLPAPLHASLRQGKVCQHLLSLSLLEGWKLCV